MAQALDRTTPPEPPSTFSNLLLGAWQHQVPIYLQMPQLLPEAAGNNTNMT